MIDLSTTVGRVTLRTPLIAASGTVGSVVDFADVTDWSVYGAAVAKSVSPEPWTGRAAPRLAPAAAGMLNSIGIQNPGIERWRAEVGPVLDRVAVPVWGSAVAHDAHGFAAVAKGLEAAGVAAVEVNLSCPNLEDGRMFALDADASAAVVSAARAATSLPLGAKLSPNAERVAEVAAAVADAGAEWVVLTNTVWGAGFDPITRRPSIAAVVGGYSGPPLKPIALRCVWEVATGVPGLPIIGCGGVMTGDDVAEYLVAGASAVQLGSVHFRRPRAARGILRRLRRVLERAGVGAVSDLVGSVRPWQ